MVKKGTMVYLGDGLYSIPLELVSGCPILDFEIAMKFAKKGAISHRSALSYYDLTDQVLISTYVTVPKVPGANLSSKKLYKAAGGRYRLIRTDPKNYWGIKSVYIEGVRVAITDFERTLIDGLVRPELCGGFREVLFAFELATLRINPTVILEYAKNTSLVVCKRLGWIFEGLELFPEAQKQLATLPMAYAQRLDPSGKRRGDINKRWNLQENIF